MVHSTSFTSQSIMLDSFGTQPLGPALRYSLGVSLSGTLMGITIAFSASANDDIKRQDYYLHPPNGFTLGLFSSLAALSAGIFGLVLGRPVNIIGKKNSLASSAIMYFIGYLLIAYSKNYALLYAGRVVTGAGLALTCLTLSPYISEIAPTRHRGKFSSVMQIQVQLGILLINALGISPLRFRYNAVFSAALAVVNLCFILISPETPRWLVSKRKVQDARRALDSLMEEDYSLVNDEMQVLQRSMVEPSLNTLEGGIRFFSKQNLKPLLLMCCIMMFQQLSAINVIMAHSNDIFIQIGLKDVRYWSAAASLGFLVFTFGSASLTDKTGRKKLLVMFGVMLSVSLLMLSLSNFIQQHSELTKGLKLVALCIYIVSFSLAWGNVPWVLCGEIFGVEQQSRDIAIVAAVNWAFNSATVFSYTFLEVKYWFLIYSICMVLGSGFVFGTLPETNGLNLFEITQLFVNSPRGYSAVSVSEQPNPDNRAK